jgi:DNA-binding NarL/FixJ family response regulator
MVAKILIVEDDSKWGPYMAGLVRPFVDVVLAASLADATPHLSEPFVGAVIDHALPDGLGLSLARRMRAHRPGLELMLFTGNDDPALVDEAARIGVTCAHKAAGFAMLERFARTCARLAAPELPAQARIEVVSRRYRLSPRERELLTHATNGLTRAQAAAQMGITDATARTYVNGLLAKTPHRRLTQLVAEVLAVTSEEPPSRSPT